MGGEDEDDIPASQESAGGAKPARVVKRYKVVIGRCPILQQPGFEQLFASGNTFLQHKQEFLADGAFFMEAENRTYLRLTRHRGWVCERSRTDIRKLAVTLSVRRKKPLSKKMARVIAFRGGDTDGVTKMRKEDLVRSKNGKIVSKKASEAAKKRFADGIGKWTAAVSKAREELGVKGFAGVKKGTPLYEKAQEYYKAAAAASASSP